MKLTVFPSGKGDCLLLESDGSRMLIDGGVSDSFRKSVLPDLAKDGRKLDCVYLSHIDDDHIGGLLALVDAVYDWRVFDFRSKTNKKLKKPAVPRPPEIAKVWHNSFSDQLEKNAGPVAAALAESAIILSGLQTSDPTAEKIRAYHENLAESTKQSLQLRYRVSATQLGIDVNPEYKKKLMFVRNGTAVTLKLGKATMQVIGPFEEDLKKLRDEWNAWLDKCKDIVRAVRQRASADAGALISSAEGSLAPLEAQAQDLAEQVAIPDLKPAELKKLGIRKKVTTPNLASLMLFLKEGSKTVLLTGDGHADDVLKGLERIKKIKSGSGLHVNVLKVQHHGAEYNMTRDFAKRITADNYIFCGNGFQTNPELIVLNTLARSRFGDPGERSTNSQVKNPFTFWFNSTSKSAQYAAHMKKVEKLADQLVAASNGQLKCRFSEKKFDVPV